MFRDWFDKRRVASFGGLLWPPIIIAFVDFSVIFRVIDCIKYRAVNMSRTCSKLRALQS